MDIETDARFQCPRCENDTAANVPLGEPLWHGENPATPEVQVVIVTCPACKEEIAARAWVTPSMCSLEFIDYPLTTISASPPMVRDAYDDDWDDFDVPSDPFAVFNTALTDAAVLLDEIKGTRYLLNRLVFANFITAFEVLLADTLINRVLSNDKVRHRLIEKDKVLSEKRFTLAQIATSPDLIETTVRSRLRAVLWHNVKNASDLYRQSFDIDIMAMFDKDTPTILKAIEYRHDCVHRNGRDKDGNDLNVFTKEYLNNIALLLSRVATTLEQKFRDLDANNFFGAPSTDPP